MLKRYMFRPLLYKRPVSFILLITNLHSGFCKISGAGNSGYVFQEIPGIQRRIRNPGLGKFLLSLFRIVLFGFLVWWIGRLLKKGDTPLGVTVGLTMITAGAMGNIIDCLFYGLIWDYAPFMFGRVVDMFYFPIIDTVFPDWMPLIGGHSFRFFAPVFNFADSCVTCGALYLLFFQFRFFAKETR